MEVHPKWYVPAATIIRELEAEFACQGRGKLLRERIQNVQREHGSLDVWRALGRPPVHVVRQS